MSHADDGISGLGIDMGTPMSTSSGYSSSQDSRQRSNGGASGRPRSMQLPESLNQYNDRRRQSSQLPVRRPTTNSERKVRVSSKPLSDPRGKTNQRYTSGPMNRNKRLGDAVAAMDFDTASTATDSDLYDSDFSPQTDSSATSYKTSSGYGSGGSNSLKRTQTVRKQVSQPNLSRTSTMISARGEQATLSDADRQRRAMAAPSADPRRIPRSKSSMSLASRYNNGASNGATTLSRSGTGSTTLGRTAEIPRSASRGASLALRNRGGNDQAREAGASIERSASDRRSVIQLRSPEVEHEPERPTISENGKQVIADGFGGFVEVNEDKKPTPAQETNQIPAVHEGQEEIERRSLQEHRTERVEQTRQAVPRPLDGNDRPQGMPSSHRPRPRSMTVGGELPSQQFRVGSFYGPGGEERARIDVNGRLSQMSQYDQQDHRNSISYESSNGHSDAYSASSSHQASSNASSSRQSTGPRLQFMASPSASAAAQSRREGGSEASGATGVSLASSKQSGSAHTVMRSVSGFRGLNGAEHGQAMVSLDDLRQGFHEGAAILPGQVRTADDESILQSVRMGSEASEGPATSSASQQRPTRHMRQASAPAGSMMHLGNASSTSLERHGTLISAQSNPARRSKDLSRLLANNSGKLSSSSSSDVASSVGSSVGSTGVSAANSKKQATGVPAPQAVLEHGKSGKSRVDVDLVLESELVVEGGVLSGRLEIKVRKNTTKDGILMLGQPKVRVVGFEELINDDTRHIFYHYATVIDGSPSVGRNPARPYVLHGSPNLSSPESDNRRPLACFASAPDAEGYCAAKEGHHSVPFSLDLPVGKGAKGSYRGKHAVVRYIVIGSIKLKSANGSNHSIAHFYRHIDLYPYLNPAIVLSSASKPTMARASKGLFLGGSGKVHLQASLHRSSWIAGQRLYVHLRIDNQTNKKVKNLSLALVRTITLYRPRPELDLASGPSYDHSETYIDPDACTTSTSRKKISEDVLEMGQKGSKGTVTARGWWTGVDAGETIEFSHNMNLPVDALTITRGRHVEVLYSLKVSVTSSLSSDVSVELPLRIVNFVSLDPPPLKSGVKLTTSSKYMKEARNAVSDSEAPMIERVRSMEALRSPQADRAPVRNDGRYLNVARHVEGMQSSTNHLLAAPREDDAKRRLQHQKSLDFINHAIRSATARRGGSGSSAGEPSPTGLGIEVDEARTPLADQDDASSQYTSSASSVSHKEAAPRASSSSSSAVHPSCQPYQHQYPPIVSLNGPVGGARALYLPSHSISLDEAGDKYDSDDEYDVDEQPLNLNDDSVADIDLVIGSAQVDGGESSPEFQQRRGMDGFSGGDMTFQSEMDSDLSNVTITSIDDYQRENGQYEDEYDEEEERLQRMQDDRSTHRRNALVAVSEEMHGDAADGDPTPLARSPPKFDSSSAALHSRSDPMSDCESVVSSTVASAYSASSASSYAASALADAQREGKTIVRTRSDLEKRLGRSSTIIRGPSGDRSRPVSPSKHAPSPTKSALKSKSSFTFATEDRPVKQRSAGLATTNEGQMLGTAPLQLRAKVERRPLPFVPQPSQSTTQNASSRPRPDDSNSANGYSSESSASPATSASQLTPRDGLSDVEPAIEDREYGEYARKGDHGGLGVQFEPAARYSPDVISPKSKRDSHLVSSASTHTLRGANVVVPSVRDKIAMLESRKQALRELTGHGEGEMSNTSPATSASSPAANRNGGTPTSSSRIPRPGSASVAMKAAGHLDPGTPTRVQAAARSFLERNNSTMSHASSTTTASGQPEYLRNMSSVQSFKAPLFQH